MNLSNPIPGILSLSYPILSLFYPIPILTFLIPTLSYPYTYPVISYFFLSYPTSRLDIPDMCWPACAIMMIADVRGCAEMEPGGVSQYKDVVLPVQGSHDRLIFNMGIPIPGKDCLYIETGPRL